MKNDEADRLLRDLAELTGESLTEAIVVSLRERLSRERRLVDGAADRSLDAAIERLRALPVIDPRSDVDILGFDDHGLPT